MNKTFIASLENHNVYLISNAQVSFYLNVLKESDNTNITIDIKYKKKDSVNDVINYYQKIDNYNITLVIPMINFEEDINKYKKQSNYISSVINYSYKLLTSNGVEVKDNINLIKHNNVNSGFIEFFINTFASRVRYLKLDNLVQEEVPYNKVDAASISFVIGKPELELTIKEDDMNEIIKETKTLKESVKEVKRSRASFATSGHVSYYLLGFLTAILTLLFLTKFIR